MVAMPRRLVQLYLGLALYALSMGLFIRSDLGVMPWDVLHQGLERWLPFSFGTVTILVGALVLLAWIPLRQRPGIVVDEVLRVVPTPHLLGVRITLLVAGVVLNAVATAAYIGARFGPGPRDGLMTGIVARTGWQVRWVRTVIEVAVVAIGWVLGGAFGIGTILYAVAVGPLVHPLLPLLRVPGPPAQTPVAEPVEMGA
jgi:uncharacterized membrane protein YczE